MTKLSQQKINQTTEKAKQDINKNLPLPNPSAEEINKVFNIWKGSETPDNKSQNQDNNKKDETYPI